VSRVANFLVYLVIAAQLLLAVPAMASSFQAPASQGADCGDMAMPHDDHCPCCPEGVTTTSDCLAACAMAAAILPTVEIVTQLVRPVAPQGLSPTELTSTESPPLKPPPIR